ncbi:MAG: prolyl oligopeptidase family serine peptidase [Amphritea sp.]|nr:prolyl oligopeptidase family serine peptidase [Amphritea sp.]
MSADTGLPGFWSSELSAEQVVSGSRDFSQLQSGSDGSLYWVEFKPAEGRSVICCESPETPGSIIGITPPGFSVESRVHEYGGRSWELAEQQLFFVNAEDQQIYSQSLGCSPDQATPLPVTRTVNSRFIEPLWCRRTQQLLAIEERHCNGEVLNRVVAVNPQNGQLQILHDDFDFYAGLALNPLAQQLAFVAWNHPHQPWTVTSLCVLELNQDLCRVVAGTGAEAIAQPQFDDKGCLFAMSDLSGWWNLYQFDCETEQRHPVFTANKDMITSPWQSGLQQYLLGPAGWALIKFQHSGSELWFSEQGSTGKVILEEFNHLRVMCQRQDQLCLVAAGEDRLLAIIEIDQYRNVRVVTGGEKPLNSDDCARPVPLRFSHSYGYFYQPANAGYVLKGRYPLVIFLHGGPTAATYPVLNLAVQYWTQRGFAVLDLNYRGSSNYGRDYRFALHRSWGRTEVDDIADAVRQLTLQKPVHRDQVFIRGSSSGGFSALNALIELDCFRAGASLYGVTDPLQLNSCTHKFESHYLSWLIADAETETERYQAVSPLIRAGRITAPVIFFQGEQDVVVLPDQTRSMVTAMQSNGVAAEAHYYADEGHGFRQPATRLEVLQRELAFYQQYIDLQAAIGPKVVE